MHCRKILQEDIIDMDEEVKEYIVTNYEQADLNGANAQIIKEIFELIEEMGVMGVCSQLCYDFLNQDLNSFI